MLNANQVVVEHRFFGTSVPFGNHWQYLTIEQAAADHHRVVEILKPIYNAAWINTGHSKGGMTAVYHRRFYPEDVDLTVPYVAPHSNGKDDPRYIDFLANVGTQDCNEKLWALQREALLRRDTLLDLFEQRTSTSYTYDRIGGYDRAFEMVILEIPFTFWQYSGEDYCSTIPAVTATDDTLYTFIDEIVGWFWPSDYVWGLFDPYFYQAHAQLGYPDVARDHLADLLLTDVPSLEEGLVPETSDPTFDPASMPDIADWFASEGDRFIFIYGEFDPWTGGAFELGEQTTNSEIYIDPGGHHGAVIATLEPADQLEIMATLEEVTGVTPDPPAKVRPEDLRYPPWRWTPTGL
jgi:hypothetical protein